MPFKYSLLRISLFFNELKWERILEIKKSVVFTYIQNERECYTVLTVSRSPDVAEPEAAPFTPILASWLASRWECSNEKTPSYSTKLTCYYKIRLSVDFWLRFWCPNSLWTIIIHWKPHCANWMFWSPGNLSDNAGHFSFFLSHSFLVSWKPNFPFGS